MPITSHLDESLCLIAVLSHFQGAARDARPHPVCRQRIACLGRLSPMQLWLSVGKISPLVTSPVNPDQMGQKASDLAGNPAARLQGDADGPVTQVS